MTIPSRGSTPEDHELMAVAKAIVDANTDGEDGVHTMGAAVRAIDATMYRGIRIILPTTEGVRVCGSRI